MLLILKSFLEIVLLIRPPQDLPGDRWLLKAVMLSYFLVGLLILWPKFGPMVSVLLLVADILISVAFVQIVLHLKGHTQRFNQTLTAMLGAGTLISLLMLPLAYGLYTSDEGSRAYGIMVLGLMLIFAWTVTVNGHIFRHAFNLSNLFIGILYALGLYLFSEIIMAVLFSAKLGGA